MVTFEDFKKVEFKIATIKEVEEHPNADRLYVIKLDVGGESLKQVVAGVRAFYTKEQLIGKQVIVADNLQPAMLRGVESNGMILAAKDDVGFTVLTVDKQVKNGTLVT